MHANDEGVGVQLEELGDEVVCGGVGDGDEAGGGVAEEGEEEGVVVGAVGEEDGVPEFDVGLYL